MTYEKPSCTVLGDFRSLTRVGSDFCADGSTILGTPTGLNPCPARS